MFLPDGECEEELRLEERLMAEPGEELLELGAELLKLEAGLLEAGAELVLGEKLLSLREEMDLEEEERNEEDGEVIFDLDGESRILSEYGLASDLEEKLLEKAWPERCLSILMEEDLSPLEEDEGENDEGGDGREILEG